MRTLLQVSDLTVHYGAIQAIRGISFEVAQGEIITMIGSNGAGKTTILLVEQNAFKAPGPAVRAYILETGYVLKSGPARELMGDPAVKAAYLGG
jgi:ABC-type branched-subunit amino acid transport system ATPase component